MWKKVVVAYLKFSRHFLGGPDKKDENPLWGWTVSGPRFWSGTSREPSRICTYSAAKFYLSYYYYFCHDSQWCEGQRIWRLKDKEPHTLTCYCFTQHTEWLRTPYSPLRTSFGNGRWLKSPWVHALVSLVLTGTQELSNLPVQYTACVLWS
jgi:hypothetical protein